MHGSQRGSAVVRARIVAMCLLGAIAAGMGACRKDTAAPATRSLTQAPAGFPEIPFPADNPYTAAKWELGKRLFYDNLLSADNSISCASCHHAAAAFSDTLPKSLGVGRTLGRRNAPTLANVAYLPYFTREGGVPTLEMQVRVPIQEHDEFNFDILKIAARLAAVPSYVAASQEVFGRQPDAFVITRALATFQRTLVSGQSQYDAYAQGNTQALSAAARQGMELFFSNRTDCASCHSGFLFTNHSFQNNGLYTTYTDVGRQRLTGDTADGALFKVPTLRNVAVTAPYMHDGSLPTLSAVVDHYNAGGNHHPHQSALVRPLGLTPQEKTNLIAFLESLTDPSFLHDRRFLP